MYDFADAMDLGANLPWQWSVAALLCWSIVLCLALLFLHPEQHERVVHRPSNRS
jgi:hypothetical protein